MPQRGSMCVIGLPRSRTSPTVGCMKPANMLIIVDLPQPRGAEQAHELAFGNIQRQALDRDDVLVPARPKTPW